MLLLLSLFPALSRTLAAPVASPQQLTGWGSATQAASTAAHACTTAAALRGVLISPSAFYGGQACGSTVFIARVDADAGAQIMVPVLGVCGGCARDDLELSPAAFGELVAGAERPDSVRVRWGLVFLS